MYKKEKSNYEVDMCHGPLLKKMLVYCLPVVATGVLQLCYNAADVIVVGRYAGATALAAVGATTHLIDFLVNLFLGLSTGISVVVAQRYGAKQLDAVNETVHTSMLMALIVGVAVGMLGITFGKSLLIMMNCPADVLEQATLYIKIYFLGMPASMVYNFGAAALRAVGNTRQPLYYLSISGMVNVLLNLLLVISFHLGIAGVAIATVAAQYLSAALILICLMHTEGSLQFQFKKLCMKWSAVKPILYYGIPAGLQTTVIAIPNVLIQASVNTFGSIAVAGTAASNNLEGFIHIAMTSVSSATLAFTGQNVGGKKYDRISKVVGISMVVVFAVSAGMAALFCLFSEPLLGLYLPSNPEAVAIGVQRNYIVFNFMFLMGFINVFMAAMRGMGSPLVPTVTVLAGVCGLRVIWVYTVFAANRTLPVLFASFPVSWVITALVQFLFYLMIYRKLMKRGREEGLLPEKS